MPSARRLNARLRDCGSRKGEGGSVENERPTGEAHVRSYGNLCRLGDGQYPCALRSAAADVSLRPEAAHRRSFQSADRGARLLRGTHNRGMAVCRRFRADLQGRTRVTEGAGRRALRRLSLLLSHFIFHNGNRGRLSLRGTSPDLRYRRNQWAVPDRMVYLIHLFRNGSPLAFAPRQKGREVKGTVLRFTISSCWVMSRLRPIWF